VPRRFITVLVVAMITVAATALSDPTPGATAQRSPRVTPARVAVGFDHGCAVTPTGGVECWGDNTFGELGVPLGVTMSATPVAANLPVGWSAIAVVVGEHHTCALLADGHVGCWGSDLAGQLGTTGRDASPGPVLVDLPLGRLVTNLNAGPSGTCVIADDGSVWCWGFQLSGELGQSTNTTHDTPQRVFMPAGETVVDLAMAYEHTCAVLDTGAITCWGSNTFGQFGNGTTAPSSTTGSASTPFLLEPGVRAIDIAAGSRSTCAVGDQGAVYCWGYNADGRLGDGTTTDRFTPGPLVPAPSRPAVQVTVGVQHACALLDDGTMGCWGANTYGQVGDGTTEQRLSPVVVAPGTIGQSITTSIYTTCAVLPDGGVTCWGRNHRGQVGDGTTTDRTSPVGARSFAEGTRLAAVAPGGSHTCVLNTAGHVWCWGLNTSGQLGRGFTSAWELELGEPITLPSVGRAKAIVSGFSHSCALLVDGNVACWGGNNVGQLGDGTTTNRPTASVAPLPGSTRATAISTGGRHTCALLADGDIVCWGGNDAGQLGDGNTINRTTPPTAITLPVADVKAIGVDAGADHTCALLANGEMTCWGRNAEGQLGDGTTIPRLSPVTVSVAPGTRALAVDTGAKHTCALLAGGAVTCWGDNEWGQLGRGTSGPGTNLLAPIGTLSLPGGHPSAVALAVGDSHTCVLLDHRGASCWGYNGTGGVGDGTGNVSVTAPATVAAQPGGRAIRSLSAGSSHTCAVLDDASLSCWGQNFNGQLGLGDRTDRTSPQLSTLPYGPTALNAVASTSAVVLSWHEATSPYQPQTWTVEGSTDGSTWWPATVSVASPSGTTVSGLANDIGYRFRVTSTTPLRTSTVTLAATVTLASPTVVTPPVLPPPVESVVDDTETPTPRPAPTAAQIAALPLRTLVDPALLRRGATVSFGIDGFDSGETVMVVVASTPQVLDEVTASANGSIRARVAIPADLDDAEHALAVWAPASGVGFRQLFGGDHRELEPDPTVDPTVDPAPPAPAVDPTGPLPSTGTGPHTLLAMALMCCIVGLTLKRRWGPAVARGPLRG
jgi:alpha-tubulin suppressor-like RCC1 family protein